MCWRHIRIKHCKFLLKFLCVVLLALVVLNVVIQLLTPVCEERQFHNSQLPKIVHVSWKNETVPPQFEAMRESHLHFFPEDDYDHIFWTDKRQDNFVMHTYPELYELYKSYKFDIQRADAFRYIALYHYGGLYMDLDYEVLDNFWHLLPDDKPAIVESPYKYSESVQNSLMSSPRGHTMWNAIFRQLHEVRDAAVFRSTGPNLFDAIDSEQYYLLDCRLWQRMPHESSSTIILNHLHRETLGRAYPMKNCLTFGDKTCPEYARHHAYASYFHETGLRALLWSI